MPQIGIVYSATTGVILRTINPDNDNHFNNMFLAPGETLLRIDKDLVGADSANMPNIDFLIPYTKNNLGIDLKPGVNAVVVDDKGIVIDNVLVCPDLYQQKLDSDGNSHTLITDIGDKDNGVGGKVTRSAIKGYSFDTKKDLFYSPLEVASLPDKDKPVFDKADIVDGGTVSSIEVTP